MGKFTKSQYNASPGDAVKLNYKYEGFETTFTVRYLGSQCGMKVLHGFSTHTDRMNWPKDTSEEFVKDLRKIFLTGHLLLELGSCAKLIVSAVHNSNLDILLRGSPEWAFGTTVRNPNSINKITAFELDINPVSTPVGEST